MLVARRGAAVFTQSIAGGIFFVRYNVHQAILNKTF